MRTPGRNGCQPAFSAQAASTWEGPRTVCPSRPIPRSYNGGSLKPRQTAATLFPSGARAERDHAAIARCGRLVIKWLPNPKGEFADAVVLVDSPSGRDAIPIGVARDATFHAERRQRRGVERDGSLQIIGPKIDVTQHGLHSPANRCRVRPGYPKPSCNSSKGIAFAAAA